MSKLLKKEEALRSSVIVKVRPLAIKSRKKIRGMAHGKIIWEHFILAAETVFYISYRDEIPLIDAAYPERFLYLISQSKVSN
ncbi:MAG: hypothetical protein ABIU55_02635 [Ferruginibacter sp.]